MLHLFKQVRIRSTDGQGFRQILEFDKVAAAKGARRHGNPTDIDNRAAMDAPELLGIQRSG